MNSISMLWRSSIRAAGVGLALAASSVIGAELEVHLLEFSGEEPMLEDFIPLLEASALPEVTSLKVEVKADGSFDFSDVKPMSYGISFDGSGKVREVESKDTGLWFKGSLEQTEDFPEMSFEFLQVTFDRLNFARDKEGALRPQPIFKTRKITGGEILEKSGWKMIWLGPAKSEAQLCLVIRLL